MQLQPSEAIRTAGPTEPGLSARIPARTMLAARPRGFAPAPCRASPRHRNRTRPECPAECPGAARRWRQGAQAANYGRAAPAPCPATAPCRIQAI
ncbi:hypothetical protein G6F59_016237 [Rhizopus arrhizus]|nr:hypothetical protein G6F59_016237 [Rhizopus arrhizus]